MLKRGNTIELLNESEFSTCKICGKTKSQAIYKFKYAQYIPDHIPETLMPVCRKCVYKEVYGGKTWRKMKKEGTLNES